MDMFDGAVRLARKYNFLVLDELDQNKKFMELLDENINQYEVEFCSNNDLIDKFNMILQ
jgi:hypothetical protein